MPNIKEYLKDFPTQQGGAIVGWICILATTAKYISSATWIPNTSWLFFLLGLAGVAAGHAAMKRMTDLNYVKAKKGTAPSSTP